MNDINKYNNDGWGLSKKCFLDIENILNDIDKPTIIEFGSGISTKFFIDYFNETKKDGKLYSFDNDSNFSSKIIDPKLNLMIRNLVECNDDDFNRMFLNSKYDRFVMKLRKLPPHTRQKNCFYNIRPDDLPKEVDLVLVDGPHGSGRSIAFLHLIDKLKSNSHIIIDDYTHYDFSEKFKQLFPINELVVEVNTGNDNQWELGGNYRIYRIK